MKKCHWFLLLTFVFQSLSPAAVTLNVLEWEGYISPYVADFKAYAKSKGMEVELNILKPYITNPTQIFEALRAQKADVVTPTCNYFKMADNQLIKVLMPIERRKLENYPKVIAQARLSNYDEFEGKKYSVPLLGGTYALACNTATIKTPPASWEVLWSPEAKGKFTLTGEQFEANIYMVMQVLGYPPNSFYDVESGKTDLEKVQTKLNALVANAKGFWPGMETVENMKTLDYITDYWFSVAAANKAGQNWKIAAPKEGQTQWFDTMALAKTLENQPEKLAAAYLLLDFMISAPAQKRILDDYGSIIVNGDPRDLSFLNIDLIWRPLSARTRNTYKIMWEKALQAAGKT
jgi:spermidine/putrescine transport system substrate-binding protein